MVPPIDARQLEELKASGDLPSPKGVALAIMRLATQDDVSVAELARIIRTDPAFVGRLIKAANGIIGYGRRPIASVQDALTVLGMPAVRTMALGFSLMTHYKAGPCKAFDYTRYWSSSLMSAVATQAVTLRTRAAAPDETYCLGLLARIGELSMATLYPVEYAEVLGELRANPEINILESETRRFGMNHAELGAAMLADWGMPRVFCEAAFLSAHGSDSGQVEGSRERVLTDTLKFSRTVGQLCVAESGERVGLLRHVLLAGSRLEFDEAATHELCDGIARDWTDWCALLSIEACRLPPFESIARDAQAPVSRVPPDPAVEVTPELATAPDAASPEAMPTGPRLSVLVALLEGGLRSSMRRVLLEADYEVAEAGDMAMAAEKALDYEPGILILDWDMLHGQDRDFLSSIRRTRIGKSMFVLLLADVPDDELRAQAYELGADDVLAKSVSPRLLLARLTAGQRMSALQSEIERDREEIRHYAAELAVSNRRLQEVAMLDPLTGFPNRRFFTDRLLQEWAASTRNKRPLSCLMVDIDRFRQINENSGHEAGDSVLRQVAAAIRSVLRSHDVVARTGGDQFLVLCPDTALEAAQACGERLRRAVESTEMVVGVLGLHVSLSIGVACRDSSTLDADALVRRSEQGMQVAKQGGRNRVASMQLRPQAGASA